MKYKDLILKSGEVWFFDEGETVFHLKDDKFFEAVKIIRVEESMIFWEEFNDIANKHLERGDFKENFLPNTKEFVSIVNNINNERINLENIENRLDTLIDNARLRLKKRFINGKYSEGTFLNKVSKEKKINRNTGRCLVKECVMCGNELNPSSIHIVELNRNVEGDIYCCSKKCLKELESYKIFKFIK